MSRTAGSKPVPKLPNASVEVHAGDEFSHAHRSVDADTTTGYWMADFSVPGEEGHEQEILDRLTPVLMVAQPKQTRIVELVLANDFDSAHALLDDARMNAVRRCIKPEDDTRESSRRAPFCA